MSLTIWRRGVMFIRLDEVTFTPPSPPKYFPPLIPKPCYRFLAEPQSHVQPSLAANVHGELLISDPCWLRYKCRTLNYWAYGEGERGSKTKSHKTLKHPFIYSPSLLFSVPDLHPHGEQSDAEAQDQPPALWRTYMSHCKGKPPPYIKVISNMIKDLWVEFRKTYWYKWNVI